MESKHTISLWPHHHLHSESPFIYNLPEGRVLQFGEEGTSVGSGSFKLEFRTALAVARLGGARTTAL